MSIVTAADVAALSDEDLTDLVIEVFELLLREPLRDLASRPGLRALPSPRQVAVLMAEDVLGALAERVKPFAAELRAAGIEPDAYDGWRAKFREWGFTKERMAVAAERAVAIAVAGGIGEGGPG